VVCVDNRVQIKNEILRYLGYSGQKIDNITNRLIEDSIDEIKYLIKERYIYKTFHISTENDRLSLIGSNLNLIGNDIRIHLNKSKTCILMAVTLGHDVDTKIRYYEKVSMTQAFILDACATAFIEEICDKVCKDIEDNLEEGKKLTNRYSPGYGDLPIDIQSEFLSILDAKKSIGLTVSSHSILIPRKSVTAILGIINKEEKKEDPSCISCNKYSSCNFKKEGKSCGY